MSSPSRNGTREDDLSEAERIAAADHQDAVEWLEDEVGRERISVLRSRKAEEQLRLLDARERDGETLSSLDQIMRQIYALAVLSDDTERMVSLPLRIAELVLECAEHGMHRGQGRRGVRQSRAEMVRKQSAIGFGRQRKRELMREGGMSATEAEMQAAEEASDLLAQRYSLFLEASTIRRAMQQADD